MLLLIVFLMVAVRMATTATAAISHHEKEQGADYD